LTSQYPKCPANIPNAATRMPCACSSLLADFCTVWNELFPVEQARIVQLLVERVDVREDALEVRIRAEGLVSLVGELRQQGERMAA
jgi:site-specific DNA recombinase